MWRVNIVKIWGKTGELVYFLFFFFCVCIIHSRATLLTHLPYAIYVAWRLLLYLANGILLTYCLSRGDVCIVRF